MVDLIKFLVLCYGVLKFISDFMQLIKTHQYRKMMMKKRWNQCLQLLEEGSNLHLSLKENMATFDMESLVKNELLSDVICGVIDIDKMTPDVIFEKFIHLKLMQPSENIYQIQDDVDRELIKSLLKLSVDHDLIRVFRLIYSQGLISVHSLLLHDCIECSSYKIMHVLMTLGLNVNSKNHQGRTPLMVAIFYRNYDATELLLQHHACVDLPDAYGITPLIAAVQQGDNKMIDLLLKYGANIDHHDKFGWTPLIWSGIVQKHHTAKLLLSRMKANEKGIEDSLTNIPLKDVGIVGALSKPEGL